MKRTWLHSLLVVGFVAPVLVACGSDGNSSSVTDEQAAVTVAESPTTTAPTVIEYTGGATYLTGWIDQFEIDEGTVETDADGAQHTRGGTIEYRLVSEDPRVAGTVTGTWNTDRWGTISGGVMTQWGEAVLTNDGGTWEARYEGAWATPTGDVLTRWWRGTGDYEGLTFYMWIIGSEIGSSHFDWSGIVVPGDPPPGV